ncbi:hypothetical protein [Flavobacterium sp.]|uniref:hypothetical protein n=1 Tax=Flavobacterium sp. TaxID=239 RepID=UPI003751FF33
MKKVMTSQFLKKSTNSFLSEVLKLNKMFFILLMIFLSINSFSQSNQRPTVLMRENFLTSLRSNTNNSTSYDTALSLMDGVQSSIYLTNNQVKTFGTKPLCMYSDIGSLGLANSSGLRVNFIEMVTIKIDSPSQLNSPINLSVVSSYKNVKYIYFRVSFNFELAQLIQAIKNCDTKCVIIYSIEKGA